MSSDGIRGLGRVPLKSEGTSTGYDADAMPDTGRLVDSVTLEEMILYAEKCAANGHYFEIGPDHARSLVGYLRRALAAGAVSAGQDFSQLRAALDSGPFKP